MAAAKAEQSRCSSKNSPELREQGFVLATLMAEWLADGVCKNNVIVGGGLQGGRTGGRLVCSVVSMSPGSFTSAPSNRKLWQL